VEEAKKIAKDIGYPVMLKAAYGGGGRGMRVVREEKELEKAFESAYREAEAFFGKGDLFIEKYLDNPKHIEVQVIGDKYGNIIHLGERDCSIQRRHQKLIEIAPSPALPKEIRMKSR